MSKEYRPLPEGETSKDSGDREVDEPLTDAQRAELDRRLARIANGTETFMPWREVEARVMQRLLSQT